MNSKELKIANIHVVSLKPPAKKLSKISSAPTKMPTRSKNIQMNKKGEDYSDTKRP